MAVPGKLTVGKDGKLTGAANLEYNKPWPCVNGTPNRTGKMRGVIMHTMVGNLPGTIASFNDPARQASAHFGIDQTGKVHQFGPIGHGWEAWAQMAGNLEWYSIEHADNGNTQNPLTGAQVTASAQIVECLSAFAGFPLQTTDSTTGHGYGTHVMGGAAWGGHTCPGPGPRAGQRTAIIALAKAIRAASTVKPPFPSGPRAADGTSSLSALAQRQSVTPAAIIFATCVNTASGALGPVDLGPLQTAYLNAGDWKAVMPTGMRLYLP